MQNNLKHYSVGGYGNNVMVDKWLTKTSYSEKFCSHFIQNCI